MKGAILKKGEEYYTFLNKVFPAFEGEQLKFNWLITNLECNCYPDARLTPDDDYIWLSGEELNDIVCKNDIQYIWGVFSAFNQSLLLEQVLQYELPYADGYKGFWRNPISIQHSLADIEIVPWDSSRVLLISKDDYLVDRFLRYFPLSEDLTSYNAK